ncbi:hypothetical protein [Desulfonatronovibrio hydrogenovorans]|nr:hypothetical protein [Desulfonatronovibrio hydrogenovorans]
MKMFLALAILLSFFGLVGRFEMAHQLEAEFYGQLEQCSVAVTSVMVGSD